MLHLWNKLKTQWKKIINLVKHIPENTEPQGVFGLLCQCHKGIKEFFYFWINNSFLLVSEIDFKDKYGTERSTSVFAKVYL